MKSEQQFVLWNTAVVNDRAVCLSPFHCVCLSSCVSYLLFLSACLCVCLLLYVCLCLCVHACVRACVHACVHVCVLSVFFFSLSLSLSLSPSLPSSLLPSHSLFPIYIAFSSREMFTKCVVKVVLMFQTVTWKWCCRKTCIWQLVVDLNSIVCEHLRWWGIWSPAEPESLWDENSPSPHSKRQGVQHQYK